MGQLTCLQPRYIEGTNRRAHTAPRRTTRFQIRLCSIPVKSRDNAAGELQQVCNSQGHCMENTGPHRKVQFTEIANEQKNTHIYKATPCKCTERE